MLKIKNSVDLTELKKFGFKYVDFYDNKQTTFYEYDLNDNATYLVVEANESDNEYRRISLSCGLYGDYPNPYIENLDILFDIIQAGLVEKE